MSAVGTVRLRVVAPNDRPAEIPEDLLRYAALDGPRRSLLLHVNELLDAIAYGTVVVVVQDGTVIQIETSEKIRLR